MAQSLEYDRIYLSMFQRGHRCCGNAQCGTRCQSPLCSACRVPRLQASPSHRHLEAARYRIEKWINLREWLCQKNRNAIVFQWTHLSRPGIGFLQAHICVKLLEFRVNACTGGVEEPERPKRYKILVNDLNKRSRVVQTWYLKVRQVVYIERKQK